MTTKKQDLSPKNNPQGVRSDLDPTRVLTMEGGTKVIPREWFGDEPTQSAIDEINAMSREQLYIDSLKAGLPRDYRIEKSIDMALIPKALLDSAPRPAD